MKADPFFYYFLIICFITFIKKNSIIFFIKKINSLLGNNLGFSICIFRNLKLSEIVMEVSDPKFSPIISFLYLKKGHVSRKIDIIVYFIIIFVVICERVSRKLGAHLIILIILSYYL